MDARPLLAFPAEAAAAQASAAAARVCTTPSPRCGTISARSPASDGTTNAARDGTMSSIVIPGLNEDDAIGKYYVHKPVLLSNPARPGVGSESFQRLRFANTGERVSEDGIHQVEDAEGCFSVRVDPPPQILETVRVELGCARWSSAADARPIAFHLPVALRCSTFVRRDVEHRAQLLRVHGRDLACDCS